MWSASVGSHTRFHLLRRGVLPECVATFIHQVFTYTAAVEAFGAKLINGEVFTANAATAAAMSQAILNSDWVDASSGFVEAKSGGEVYTRPLIALQFNTDMKDHNYADSRIPEIADTGSVAYSTGGNTTLGESFVSIDQCEAEEVRITGEWDADSVAASSIGSTDSQDWGVKATPVANEESTGGGIIDNINDMVVLATENPPEGTQTRNSPPRTMEELHLELARLRASNAELAAAALAATQGSHPPAPPPDMPGATGAKGGGNY